MCGKKHDWDVIDGFFVCVWGCHVPHIWQIVTTASRKMCSKETRQQKQS